MLTCRVTRVFSFVLLLGTHLSAQEIAKHHTDFGRVSLYFEENKGQTDARARYIARSASLVGFVLQDGWTLSLGGQPVSMQVKGADPKATLVPEGSIEGITNYYLGSRAITALPHFLSVRAKNIRPGIDIVYHGNQRELEYDLVVHPGADVDAFWVRFAGSQPVLADNGDVVLKTDKGEVRQHKPRVWQEANGQRSEVECSYVIAKSGDVGFVLSNYDQSADLVVDPIISYSTYLTGSNADVVSGIAVDSNGSAYITGSTESRDFPVTSGSLLGIRAVFVSKLNPSGTGLVYSTFIGSGSSAGIAVDGVGNAYVTGTASSFENFPVTVYHFDPGQHAFAFKLGPTGNLVYSTALSGNRFETGVAIATDASGSAYVTGSTDSTNFPVTPGSYQTTPGGIFVAKLSFSGLILYATYLAGRGDSPASIAVDLSGNAYVGGTTASPNFPTTVGAYAIAFGGYQDGFVAKLNPSGSSLVYATYLGGSGIDLVSGLAADASGNCYATGYTQSANFPVTPGAFSTSKGSAGVLGSGFVTKLNATGTALVYSTFLGGNGNDDASRIAVDSSGFAYVVGTSRSTNFPVTPGALKTAAVSPTDYDIFVTKLAVDGGSLAYSTLLGGSNFESANGGLALDGSGGVYTAGSSCGPLYPITANAFQTSNPKTCPAQSGNLAIVVTKIDFSSPTLCNPSISPPSQSLPGRGGDISFSLTLAPGCPWEAVIGGSLTLTGPTHGVVSASPMLFTGTVAQNPSTSSGLTESVQIGTATFTVNQDAGSCQDPVIDPQPITVSSMRQSRSLSLMLPSACAWTAVSGAPWLVVFQNPSGVGPATIGISAGANNFSQRTTTLTIAGKPFTVTQSGATPTLSVSRTSLNFNTSFNGIATSPQTVTINFTGIAGAPWTAISSLSNIVVLPGSGTGNGSFQVSARSGPNGVVTVTAPGLAGSPKQIQVNISNAPIGSPFGSFDAPADNTAFVTGALPVTGWALDNVEVTKVDIWREPVGSEPPGALIFIGDAVFVAGARPDVEALNPTVPFNYRAGWGYQMLTNLLPNANGTFKLHAIAHNNAGSSTDLGTKTIIVDNAHAYKPFGTLDTPGQGGSASGNAFVNFGWALAQNPRKIPIDGSTILVVVDGQFIGHPTYNQFRSDIATLFPGYMNSGGAVGFFYLDTTNFTNGVHTISWSVSDNTGILEGIGSRYFSVLNNGSAPTAEPEEPLLTEETRNRAASVVNRTTPWAALSADKLNLNKYPSPRERFPEDHPHSIEIEELALVELPLGAISGYQLVNGEHRPLPIGSSLKHGVFYWQPGPGFLGQFHLIFEHQDRTESHVRVKIKPKTYRDSSSVEN